MTLSEAIKHLEEEIPNIECAECRKEHEQLLKWLKALEIMKKKQVIVDNLSTRENLTEEEINLLKEVLK